MSVKPVMLNELVNIYSLLDNSTKWKCYYGPSGYIMVHSPWPLKELAINWCDANMAYVCDHAR